MIAGKIDVKKITKSRLYVGAKGTYLDFKLIPTPDSEYGDYMIVESTSRQEYENGIKGVILGNAKILSNTGGVKKEDPPQGNFDAQPDDLPF